MKAAKNAIEWDVICPHCKTRLVVEDPDDFDDEVERGHDERHLMECPYCYGLMWVPVSWEPTYGEPDPMEE
jgi:uncharacterized protein with PIN domain